MIYRDGMHISVSLRIEAKMFNLKILSLFGFFNGTKSFYCRFWILKKIQDGNKWKLLQYSEYSCFKLETFLCFFFFLVVVVVVTGLSTVGWWFLQELRLLKKRLRGWDVLAHQTSNSCKWGFWSVSVFKKVHNHKYSVVKLRWKRSSL